MQYTILRGIAGLVIDGVYWDVNRAIKDDYPLFTSGWWMRTGKDWVQVGGVNELVGIGRIHVNLRDIIVADANSIVIVLWDWSHEGAEVARKIKKSEEYIYNIITNGATIAEA
jgi:regulator of RNase E activity RraA